MADDGDPKTSASGGDLQGQADLFAARKAGRALALASPVVEADADQVERRFGRGRPPGARNVATQQRLEMFARIAGDPLLQSATILAMPLEVLAGELGCNRLEAAKFKQREREIALPYVLSKRPQAVEVKGNVVPLYLFAGSPAAPGALAGGAVALFDLAAQEAEYEEVESRDIPDA